MLYIFHATVLYTHIFKAININILQQVGKKVFVFFAVLDRNVHTTDHFQSMVQSQMDECNKIQAKSIFSLQL
jgi:hypothetical protein